MDQTEAEMIYCPVCGTGNRHGSKYCNECGVKFDPQLQVNCPECGTLSSASDPQCTACGASLASPPTVPGPTAPTTGSEAVTFVPETDENGIPYWLEGMPSSLIDQVQTAAGPGSAVNGPIGRCRTIGIDISCGKADRIYRRTPGPPVEEAIAISPMMARGRAGPGKRKTR